MSKKLDGAEIAAAFIVAVLILIAVVIASTPVQASELVAARPALKFIPTFADTFMVSIPPGQSAGTLPSAYLFYSRDGSLFSFRRWYDGAPETNWIDVPAGSSMTIPAPSPFLYENHWHHIFAIDGAQTDSVTVIPLDR